MKRVQFSGFRNTFYCVLAIALVFAACKKGDTGPEGPAGPAGPQGNQGPKGDTGVANVIYSAWLDVTFSPELDDDGNLLFNGATISAPKLTSAILGSGTFQTYVNLGTAGEPAVYPLPFNGNAFIDVEYVVGGINLFSNANASTNGTGNAKRLQYRYVLIPGGKPARSIDWNDYEQVKTYLGLKD